MAKLLRFSVVYYEILTKSCEDFSYGISYQATSEGVLHVLFVTKFKNLNFGKFFKFVTLTLSSFD